MRIAYVCADHGIPLFGEKGGAVHIRELVRAMAALGHDVHVLAARIGEPEPDFPARFSKARIDTASPDLENSRAAKERRNLLIAEALRDDLVALNADRPFDLIYERYSLWSAAGPEAARSLGIPCILEVNAPLRLEQQRYRTLMHVDEAERIERRAFSGASAVAAVSKEVAAYVAANGGRAADTHVVPNGVDPERFNARVAPLEIEGLGDGPVVGFVGSLKIWHGIDVLLESFRLVAAQRGDARLLIAGDGPKRGYVDGFASGSGLRERIVSLGWVGHDRMPSLLRRMDIAVAPYPQSDDFYFSPLKLFEYMAAGLPIVASKIGQIGEILDGGSTGLLVRPGDPQDLADTLLVLLSEPETRAEMGRNAAARARGHTWQHNAKRVTELATALRRAA